MKFFIDTADIEAIKRVSEWIDLDGVTTNPSLIAKSGRDFKDVVLEISKLVDGDISAEVISEDAPSMIEEAIELGQIANNIVIKIPATTEGLKAIKVLSKKGIRTNTTLVFSAAQALLAAKSGTDFVSPFIGRLDDRGEDGSEVVKSISDALKSASFSTEVIAASIRSPKHVENMALAGVDICTIPPKVYEEMMEHELTTAGIEKFLNDYRGGKDE